MIVRRRWARSETPDQRSTQRLRHERQLAPRADLATIYAGTGKSLRKASGLGRLVPDVKHLTLQPQIVTMPELIVDLSPAQGGSDDELISGEFPKYGFAVLAKWLDRFQGRARLEVYPW